MNWKNLKFLIISMILIELSSTEEADVSALQREIRRLTNAEHFYQQQIKSLQSKLNFLLMERCTRSSKFGKQTSKLPSSCAEAAQYGRPSGIYKLKIAGMEPFDVYCLKDPNQGPAWTVVQRRQDGSVDFYRVWHEYKNGFGNLSGEFFIGLDKLHALTADQPNELWIQLEDFEGEKRYANYKSFAIDNENNKYALSTLDGYIGNAGDSLIQHKGYKFSTNDVDNHVGNGMNCAVTYTGAWWYYTCYHSNLNGKYGKNQSVNGINWNAWKLNYSFKYDHMAIRPVNT